MRELTVIGIVMLSSCLLLFGAAVGWRSRHRPVQARPAPRLPVSVDCGEDLLPGSAGGERVDGLAIFYACQMATSRIDRAG
jgi:hypothetical protein